MGITTEPPWLHKTVGTAPRNGTNTHLIDFTTDGDAPFTPAAGSYLVVIVAGSVTHTVSAGDWTEQLQPVSSAELSVFSATAVGHTGITVVHNGSNYEIGFAVFELPAGSTYTGGVSNNGAGDTSPFPALTGLPGAEQLIIAARARGMSTAVITTGQSTAWNAPYIEDADIFRQPSVTPTDTFYMTVAHAINLTATSVTPTDTTTTIGQSGANDRQQVVFAINAVAPSSDMPTERVTPDVVANLTGRIRATPVPAVASSGLPTVRAVLGPR